nr:Uncharacterised protein [Klebsiella pneumoniae]
MSGELKPVLNEFKGEPVTRRIRENHEHPSVSIDEYEQAYKTDPNESHFTAPGADRLLRPQRRIVKDLFNQNVNTMRNNKALRTQIHGGNSLSGAEAFYLLRFRRSRNPDTLEKCTNPCGIVDRCRRRTPRLLRLPPTIAAQSWHRDASGIRSRRMSGSM